MSKNRRVIIYQKKKNINGIWNKEISGKGIFHEWGYSSNLDSGGSDSTAIVELEDGTVKNVYCENIKFVDPLS